MRWFRKEDGQVLVLTALCMTAFVGFLALGIDVGLVFRTQRNLQIAADAAATAAALDFFYDSSATAATRISDAKTVGTTAANNNGVSTANGATITMNSGNLGEISTPWHNSSGYFEAILTEPAPTAFMGYFGISSMTVSARAVAGTPNGNQQGCMYILNRTGNLGPGGHGDSTMYLQGSFQVNAPKCGITVDGTASDTLYYQGNGGETKAAWIGVAGGAGGHYSSYTPQPKTGIAPVSDPFTAYDVPVASGPNGVCTGSNTVTTATGTIGATGTLTCDSATTITNATFAGTVILTASSVTFGGNISSYCAAGSAATTSSCLTSPAAGDGTMIVFDNGSFTENAGTVFNLVPETAASGGTYAPDNIPTVVLAAPYSNTSTMQLQFGNSSGTFEGTVYMPGATFFFQDSGGDHSGGLTFNINLVVGQLDDQTTTLNINGYTPPAGSPDPLNLVALVE